MADYIDRQALVEKLATLATRYNALGRVEVAQDYNWAITVLEGEPAADVAKVEHGKPITKIRTVMLTGYHEEIGVFAKDGSNLYRKKMAQADIPYDHCPVCGAVLCSRWHNFCGKCGAKMDGGQQNE